jgi:uncharacterized membrane protein YphA (DoxX/SURF4 family)
MERIAPSVSYAIIPNINSATDSSHSWLRRFIFRFVAVYLVFFNLPFPLGLNFGATWVDKSYAKLWQTIVAWVGEQLLGIGRVSLPAFINSDSPGGWLRVWCCLTLSVGVALIWSWFDPLRRYDGRTNQVVRVYVRYVLSAAMISYGMSKVLGMQFPFPDMNRLHQTYAESSPTSLLWTFMGYGTAYSVLAGIAELLGGLLLLFRRTTTLGAVVVAAVMTNVVTLNLCYDVPVKLYSIHLLLFAVFLLAPDLNRLTDVLLFNRPVAAVSLARIWPVRWMATAAFVVKPLIVGWIVFANASPSVRFAVHQRTLTKSELYGIYDVESFTRNGQVVAPLRTDTKRWQRIAIDADGEGWVRRMDNTDLFAFSAKIDRTQSSLTLNPFDNGRGGAPIVMAYTREAPDRLLLLGKVDDVEISVLLHRLDEKSFRLLESKFRWTR